MENLPALNLKNLDKSQWKTYRFDEIAKNISERVDPNNTDLEVYVGLEHIDSESIHLTRSGTPDDVDGQKLRFYKGDLIFGRRRAYQRKAAIATSDGFCSAHALVLRANPEVIHPQLFPFFMHSDAFMHRAMDISVGSLSPTINWGTLKNQKFILPPLKIQNELKELLINNDNLVIKETDLLIALKNYEMGALKHYFYDDRVSDRVKLKKIIDIKKGSKPLKLISSDEGLPYCTTNYLRSNEIEYRIPFDSISGSTLVEDDDIILLWDGSNAGEMFKGKKGILASTMCKLSIKNEDFSRNFIFQFLRFKTFDIKRATVGSAIPHVDPSMIQNIEIPKLSKENQGELEKLFTYLSESINETITKIESSKSLQKQLINRVF